MIRYVFREPMTLQNAQKANPQIIGKALDGIRKGHGGRLTPKNVVEAARADNHPLHPYFEWDRDKAAQLYLEEQARTIIRCVRVIDEEGTERPAFLSIKDKSGTSYRSIEDVLESRDLQLLVMKQAERDLEAFQERYRELTDICDLIREARTKLSGRIARRTKRIEHRPQA